MIIYTSAEAIADIRGAEYETLKTRRALLAGVIDLASAEHKAISDEIRKREKVIAAQLRLGTVSKADKQIYRDLINSPSFARGQAKEM